MNIDRAWALTKIFFQSHVFNWPWRSREHRRDVRTNVLSRVAPEYFKRYLPAVKSVKETEVIKDDENEKIFTIWQQGEENAPELVKSCFRSIRKHCKQELVVLDDNNIFDYITLPDVIVEKYKAGKIRRAHFADICRVELLYKYGGFWLDSTDFVVSEIPQWIVDTDFFMFLVGEKVGQKYMFCQNCFIRGRRGSYLLGAWRAMILAYWMNEQKSFDYFMHQMLFQTLVQNDELGKKYFEQMPHVPQDPTHSLWHEYKFKKFDKKLFDKLTADAFFQKTAYADAPQPGTFSEAICNMNK